MQWHKLVFSFLATQDVEVLPRFDTIHVLEVHAIDAFAAMIDGVGWDGLGWGGVVPAQRVAFFATPYVRPPADPAVWVPWPRQSSELEASPMADQPCRARVPLLFMYDAYWNSLWVFLIP